MLSLVLGSEITDASVAAIVSSYSRLELLDLSGYVSLSDILFGSSILLGWQILECLIIYVQIIYYLTNFHLSWYVIATLTNNIGVAIELSLWLRSRLIF